MKKVLEQKVVEAVQNVYGVVLDEVLVEHPDNSKYGDFSTNVSLTLKGKVDQSPMEIAKKLCYELQSFDLYKYVEHKKIKYFESIDFVSPGFINFKLSQDWLKSVPFDISSNPHSYGSSKIGDKKTVLLEYSQPNPNKPLHIGHSRNNFLGSSLANIFDFLGYNVIRANYMNDWGIHICKSMLMYKKYHFGEIFNMKPDHFVGRLYTEYGRREINDPNLKEEVGEMFRKLELGDAETVDLWKKITHWVYEGWKETYDNEGVIFDIWFYQNEYRKSGKDVVNKAVTDGIAEKDSSGAIIAKLKDKYGIPDKVLLRADGTSVYATQDIQLAKDGYDKYKFDKRFYIVDYRQNDYFKQVFLIAKALGYSWADRLYHISYGTVELPEGKMSSREGLVVNADEVFTKLVEFEKDEIKGKVDNFEDTARKVALAAYRFGMLKVSPKQNIVFDYDKVTKYEGNTGPYLMYTHSRASSVLGKAGFMEDLIGDYSSEDVSLESSEKDLLRVVYKFPEVVEEAGEHLAPNLIANFALELAQTFNTFYGNVSILSTADRNQKLFRLHLVSSVAHVIENALNLLGIQTVSKM